MKNLEMQAAEMLAAQDDTFVVSFELSAAQITALELMEKSGDKNSVARASFSARLKSDYKRYRDGASLAMEKLYDDAAKRGLMAPGINKASWIAEQMADVNKVFNAL